MGKIKTGAYIPLPVTALALVGSKVNGKPNYLPVGFVSGVNADPPIIGVSLNNGHYTPAGIIENGSFSVNVPSAKYVMETDYCGLVSGRDVDKSRIFTTFYGSLGTAPMIADFPIVCECRYTGQKIEFAMDTVYFGQVLQVYVDEDLASEDGRIDVLRAHPLCYSGLENRYRALGEDLGAGWGIGRQYKPDQGARQAAGPADGLFPAEKADRDGGADDRKHDHQEHGDEGAG